jgi:hypothetical protein
VARIILIRHDCGMTRFGIVIPIQGFRFGAAGPM